MNFERGNNYRIKSSGGKYFNYASHLLILSISVYFPVYSLSIISGYPGHQLLAIILTIFSLFIYCRSRRNIILVLLAASYLLIKFYFTQDFQLRFIGVSLIGWFILLSIIGCIDRVSSKVFLKLIAKLIWFQLFIVFIIVCLQYFGFLPIVVGNLNFVNSVVAGFSDNLIGFARPNGYFYHPYDLAIFLSPFIFLFWYKRIKPGIISSLVIGYFVYLKSLFVYIVFSVLFNKTPRFITDRAWLLISLTFAGAGIITGLAIFFADSSFTAGRIFLWDLYLSDYSFGTASSYAFGLSNDQITISRYMPDGRMALPHNQFIFFLIFGGVLHLFLFVFLFREALLKVNKIVRLYIIACFLSLGITGDLAIMFPFWISACIFIMLTYTSNVNKD